MYAKLISSGRMLPRSLNCEYGHLPRGYMNCFDGYVPYFGLCDFGKD
ncbi:MAG: hypothetical protein HXS48_25595 [Theionarchaea archaeon]|nr:hypothetical protein [Theionarchaea archaeon]